MKTQSEVNAAIESLYGLIESRAEIIRATIDGAEAQVRAELFDEDSRTASIMAGVLDWVLDDFEDEDDRQQNKLESLLRRIQE